MTEKEIQIEAVARETTERDGNFSRGIKSGDIWYNVVGVTKEDVDVFFDKEFISKGNTILVDHKEDSKNNEIKPLKMTAKEVYNKEDGFHGDETINLNTLLNSAHKNNLMGIRTEMISIDHEKKIAVFKATVLMYETIDKTKPPMIKEYHGHGDAEAEKLSENIREHYIRMAETRAICRALRWATNNAKVAIEETTHQKVEQIKDTKKEQKTKKVEGKA